MWENMWHKQQAGNYFFFLIIIVVIYYIFLQFDIKHGRRGGGSPREVDGEHSRVAALTEKPAPLRLFSGAGTRPDLNVSPI